MMGAEFVQLSLAPLLIGALAATVCALPGNFLLLRRQALIGDAMSHVVLPGVVAGFLLSGGTSTLAMLLGATAAALVAAGAIELVRRLGRVEPGAAMGVVFTAMFAGGVLLLEQSVGGDVHLDVEHALYGNLESLIWLDATGWTSLLDPRALAGAPPALPRLAVAVAILAILTRLFWKELALSTFDPGFAASVGARPGLVGAGLAAATALAAVTAFEAVGSIIVIAMFVCPPAAARLMTDRLDRQVAWSLGFALAAAILGYVLAGYGPVWLGFAASVSAAGTMATVSGLILLAACLWGPKRRRAGVTAV
ncbi:MAG: metal ABC transporter permease [Rubrimonas sp.]|uniref:metal ABC transporter permease n=1 Tax=Rubrimonas sp. TaxID=2036015 RepID=UPI002FDCE348